MVEPGLKVIRRKLYALFRKRFREIMKLRREVKLREHAGHYTTRGKDEVLNSHFLPESVTTAVKRLAIVCLMQVFFVSMATLMSPSAAMNVVMIQISGHTSGLWLVYWVPTVLYLVSVMFAFQIGSRCSVSVNLKSFYDLSKTFYSSLYDLFSLAHLERLLGFCHIPLALDGPSSLLRGWQEVPQCIR